LARRTEYCSRDCYLKKTQGRVKNSSGYILIYQPEHPHATKAGQVLEHRVVMEKMIGRYLKPHENVHHKNGDRTDNKPTNLELWIKRQPPGQRIEDLMAWAEQLLKHYKPIAQKLRAYQPDDPRQAKLFEAI
jgi:hypothetical protein